MKLITINNKTIHVPENWNELTAKQLQAVMNILFIQKYSPELMVVHLMRLLFGMDINEFKKLAPEDIEEYLDLVVFLLQGPLNLTKNIIPKYQYKGSWGIGKIFYGPEDECMNLIMDELVFSESYFMSWFDNKEDLHLLNELVAVLYRPAKRKYNLKRNPEGDVREPFNQYNCSFHAKRYIQMWPLPIKLGIAYWFRGCWQKWMNDNPNVFKGDGDPAQYGMISVMRNVAKDGVYGDIEKVGKTYVNQILMELNEVVAEADKIKQNSPTV
ncbi:MAG: hypothetical protein ACJ748_11330 [Flavisolibacter sp.]